MHWLNTRERRWVAYGVAAAAALVPRIWMLDFESGDYRHFLGPWYDYLVQHGRWAALGHDFSNYYVPYLVLLSLATLLPLPKLYAIKLISIAFDYVAAWLVGRLVWHHHRNHSLAWGGFAAVLFLPTVLLNSSLWGQCDIIYTSALLVVLLSILKQQAGLALAAFGLAVAFKPQAIFFVPFLGGLLLSGQLPWRLLWVPLAVYAVCGLPAMLAGKPVGEVLGHWLWQENLPYLTAGAANIYQWLPSEPYRLWWWAGVVLGTGGAFGLMLFMRRRRAALNGGTGMAATALLSVLFMPFFLPGMHERYFFPADLYALVYALFTPQRWWVAVWVQAASIFAYFPYLFGQEPVPRPLLTLLLLAAMGLVAWGCLRNGQRSCPLNDRAMEAA